MTTVINTPPSGNNSDSGSGIILGVIVALILVTLFFIYVLPVLRTNMNTAPKNDSMNINVTLPTSTTPTTGNPPATPITP